MKDLAIIVLTRGRWEKQTTLMNIPRRLKENLFLIIDEDEKKEYSIYKSRVKKIFAMPRKHSEHKFKGNISDKKQWICRKLHKQGYKYAMLLDDDMSFHTRKNKKLVNKIPATPNK